MIRTNRTLAPRWSAAALLVLWALPLLLAGTVAPAHGQEALSEEELRREPGYVDFGDLWRYSDGDEEMEIHLTQPLLGVVGAFVKGEDPELAELIRNLHLVKVNGFSFGRSDEDDVRDMMDDTASTLRGEGWDNIVKVRERGERVNVFVKFEGDQRTQENTFLSGLTVLVYEEDKATFVNVVGRFRLEDIAKVGQHFEIPSSQDWDRYDRRRDDRDRDRDRSGGGGDREDW